MFSGGDFPSPPEFCEKTQEMTESHRLRRLTKIIKTLLHRVLMTKFLVGKYRILFFLRFLWQTSILK